MPILDPESGCESRPRVAALSSQVLPIWTIFNTATFTHRERQGQTANDSLEGKMQLNSLINFDALLAGNFGHPSINVFMAFLNLVCSQL